MCLHGQRQVQATRVCAWGDFRGWEGSHAVVQAPYTHPVTAWRARAYSFALRASRGAGRASIATTLPLQKFVSHVLLGACNWPHVAWCCSPLPQCGVHAGLGEVDTVSWLRGRAGTQFLREVWRREQLYEVWAVRFFLCPGPAWSGLCVTGARQRAHHTPPYCLDCLHCRKRGDGLQDLEVSVSNKAACTRHTN